MSSKVNFKPSKTFNIRSKTNKSQIKNYKNKKSSEKSFKSLTTANGRSFLSQIASKILSEPTSNLIHLDSLFSLYSYCLTEKNLKNLGQLTFVTIATIITDLIPSYNLSEESTSSATQSQSISKSISNLFNYEKQLLNRILKFLNITKSLLDTHPQLCVPILTRLLCTIGDSSYRDEIINLCLNLNKKLKRSYPQLSKMCCDSLYRISSEDSTLRTYMKIVKLISDNERLFKKKSSGKSPKTIISQDLLEIFNKIDTKILYIRSQQPCFSFNYNDKNYDKSLHRDLRAGSLIEDFEQSKKHENIILTELMVIYLRVLESPQIYSDGTIITSFNGLSKLGQFIKSSLLDEILQDVKALLLQDHLLSPTAYLAGINASLKIFGYNKNEIQVDVSWLAPVIIRVLLSSLSQQCSSNLCCNNPFEFQFYCLEIIENFLKITIPRQNCISNPSDSKTIFQLLSTILATSLHSDPIFCSLTCSKTENLLVYYGKFISSSAFNGHLELSGPEIPSIFWQFEFLTKHSSNLLNESAMKLFKQTKKQESLEYLHDRTFLSNLNTGAYFSNLSQELGAEMKELINPSSLTLGLSKHSKIINELNLLLDSSKNSFSKIYPELKSFSLQSNTLLPISNTKFFKTQLKNSYYINNWLTRFGD